MTLSIQLAATPVTYAGDATTRVYVLLGHPVAHSRSPVMQTAALRAAGANAVYVACDVRPEELHEALRRLRVAAADGRIAGANVTVPHKQAVLSALEDLDPPARLAGAVNTLVITTFGSGAAVALRGANTDVAAVASALADLGRTLGGARLVVLGAGGMARATVAAALQAGAAEVCVCSRDPSHAQALLDGVTAGWRGRLPRLACAALDVGTHASLAGADVLVHATPLGLHAGDPLPIDLGGAPPHLVVLDTVYGEAPTPLVRSAQARGLRASDGLGLLAYQGAAAFALWTGLAPPLAVMRQALGL